MSHFRTRSDITRLLHDLISEVAWWLTSPHHLHDLLRCIDDQHPAHPKAQNLDGERHGSGISRPTERAALTPDRSAADLRQLQADLEYLDRMVTRWRNWRGYVTKAKRPLAHKPGETTCPPTNCRTCWDNGATELVDPARAKAKECRWCATERAKIGQRVPVEIWRLHQQGRRVTVADYRRLAPEVARRLTVEVAV